MKKIVLTLSALTLGIFGCTNTDNQTKLQTILELDSVVSHELFTLGSGTYEHKMEVGIKYTYPTNDTLLSRALAAKFFPDSLSSRTLNPDSLVSTYAEFIYGEYATDEILDAIARGEPMGPTWCAEASNELVYHDKHIASNITSQYSFIGGAHGLEQLSVLSIDRKTGQHLQESDLFIEGYETELAQIIVSRLMTMHSVSKPAELTEYGYFDPTEITPNNNFYLTDTEMVYIFNPYDIAPYANGRIEVRIPYDLLGQLIRPSSILEHYV
ncbi:MAG: RsiV family protein [Porphyromonadaceae bacterium]|nr:RsiV family protein [Porphyromonadaceae bacterium]